MDVLSTKLFALSLLVGCSYREPLLEISPDASEIAIDSNDGIDSAWLVELQDPTIKLNAVWGSSATDIYAVGRKGTAPAILHSTGDGHWTEQPAGANGELLTVWGSGPNDIYVGGFGDTLLHSTGNGVWTQQSIPILFILQIGGTSANDVYVADSTGVLYHSTGNGVWTALAIGDSDAGISAVWGTSAANVRFGGKSGLAPYVVRGASNPTAETLPAPTDDRGRSIAKMWGSATNDLYAVGSGLSIYHSDGSGTWTFQPGPTGNDGFADVWGSARDDIYVVSPQAGVYHSTGNGAWSRVPHLYSEPHGVWGAGANDVYVVGNTIAHLKR